MSIHIFYHIIYNNLNVEIYTALTIEHTSSGDDGECGGGRT